MEVAGYQVLIHIYYLVPLSYQHFFDYICKSGQVRQRSIEGLNNT